MGERLGKKEKQEEDQIQQQPQIVEVPINLELINNKLNYIITKIEAMDNSK